jgi:hypothetical protein
MSLLEGRATWAAELACRAAGRPALDMFTLEEARDAQILQTGADDNAAEALGKGMVNVLARAKLVQYAYGRDFARRAWEFGGEKFFGQVFDHLPLSQAELEDFSRFKRRWAAEMEAAMDAEQPPTGETP